MNYEDEIPTGNRVVRSFIATGGRGRTAGASELALEALIEATPEARRNSARLQFERRSIVELLVTSKSIAEISAGLSLPMRAAQVLVSEMVADGTLTAQETISNADIDLLLRIRSTIAAL